MNPVVDANITQNFGKAQKVFGEILDGNKPINDEVLKAAKAVQGAYVTLQRIQVQREKQVFGIIKDLSRDGEELKRYIARTMPQMQLVEKTNSGGKKKRR